MNQEKTIAEPAEIVAVTPAKRDNNETVIVLTIRLSDNTTENRSFKLSNVDRLRGDIQKLLPLLHYSPVPTVGPVTGLKKHLQKRKNKGGES